jgi:hypothetical protein
VDYHDVPVKLTRAVPRSPTLQRLIHWMLAPEPGDRPSVDQVLREAGTMLFRF